MLSVRQLLTLICFAALGCAIPRAGLGQRRWTAPAGLDRSGLTSLVGTQRADTSSRLPDGTGLLGGWLLGGPNAEISTRFGISLFQRGRRQYLTFDSLVTLGPRHSVWKVLDAIWIPRVPASLVFVPACAYESQLRSGDLNPDQSIAGIAELEEAEWFSRIRFAWRADTVSLRFQVAAVAGLRCKNEAWELP